MSEFGIRIFEDCFNMLCGEMIGRGIHRKTFECKIRPDLVVKVEYDEDYRDFANVKEMQFWCDYQDHAPTAKWLAPCEYLSPDGRILLQKRAVPVAAADLPKRVPGFLNDIKPENFGIFEGRVVCLDYSSTSHLLDRKPKNADWDVY